ncbi:MAG: glycosyltransferase [Candidatus Gottesmanbacteria bacterium]
MKKNIYHITIIMPVKDEKENILWTIERIEKVVVPDHEIFIIYDSDKDNSLIILNKIKNKYPCLHLIKNHYGHGVINAIRTGFNQANGNLIVMMAADRTDDPETINKMFLKIQKGYDIVCPTRYAKGGKVIGKISLKSILSRLSGISTPLFLGIPTTDLTYSYKMFTKEVIDKIHIESRGGFEFAEELLIKAHFSGFKITEVPTLWVDRTYGKSQFKLFSWLPRYIYWYLLGIFWRVRNQIIFFFKKKPATIDISR